MTMSEARTPVGTLDARTAGLPLVDPEAEARLTLARVYLKWDSTLVFVLGGAIAVSALDCLWQSVRFWE